MSLKSKPLIIEGVLTETYEKGAEKADCWCSGRKMKLHKVGDPFCHFPVSYKEPPPEKTVITDGRDQLGNLVVTPLTSVTSPVTFDEDLLMSCINRAIMKTPADFVLMLDEGRVNHAQARRINAELRAMGYCISEEPF